MQSLFANGTRSCGADCIDYPQKRNGRRRAAAAWTMPNLPGATNYPMPSNTSLEIGRRLAPSASFAQMDIRFTTLATMSTNGAATGLILTIIRTLPKTIPQARNPEHGGSHVAVLGVITLRRPEQH